MSSNAFRAGLQIPNFNLPGTEPGDLLDKLTDIATTAEASGFDALYVMDHLHQLPGLGPQSNWMLEGPTTLSALAARTKTINLGLMVGGITYRNPALHAKITTTIDVLSGGRAIMGIGAAWFEDEHKAYDFHFGTLGERFERLEDGLQIMRAMFASGDETSTVAGKHHSVAGAYNNPKVRSDIPILIGGSGEKKTLRMVAQYAQASNVFGDVAQIKHLMGVLDQHCADIGRDPSEIARTKLSTLILGDTAEAAEAKAAPVREAMGERGAVMVLSGTTEQVAEQLAAHREAGLTGIIVNMLEAHDLEQVQAAAEVCAAAFA
jgi:F420-dependent oxidoreductase-like protein